MSSRAQDRLRAIVARVKDASSRRELAGWTAEEVAAEIGSGFLALYLWNEARGALEVGATFGEETAGPEGGCSEWIDPEACFGPPSRACRQSRWQAADSGATDLVPLVCAGRFEG